MCASNFQISINSNKFYCFIQLRLNVERLKSDRGIHALEKYCSDLKFHGKGYERHDLDGLMKRLEHWAHRLYPNYRFDDFVTQVEKLGRKKEMQTHLHRYRHGMLEDLSDKNKADNELDEHNDDGEGSRIEGVEPIDELDEIIDQQLQNYTMFSSASKTPSHDRTFDSIRSSVLATPRLREQHPIEQSTPLTKPLARQLIDTNVINTPPPNKLTSDQMARIAENRRLAQERLRQKRLEAAANATLNDTTNENMEF